ncbi:hypothetical protein V7S43_012207 [Phytophthora oleae]|uniref:Uncharacterized protein n=1 Tax=Phytophthora oleae TaxID=2107226 RepID=A0ABD3F7F4_9STRA
MPNLTLWKSCEPGTEATELAGTDVQPENEESEKELEARLYPFDEGEMFARVAQNAEAAKDPSLEDLSLLLSIPLDTLERTRQASPDDLGTPEHWQEWFQGTLETSEEVKRANWDFRAPVVSTVTPAKPKKTRVETVRSAGGVRPPGKDGDSKENGTVEDEDLVGANILLSLDIRLESDETVRKPRTGSPRVLLRRDEWKLARRVARRAVYRFLKL